MGTVTKRFGATLANRPFLSRLLRVDVKSGSQMSVRPSVRPQKVSSISMKFGM